jgi:hypothetical protein
MFAGANLQEYFKLIKILI